MPFRNRRSYRRNRRLSKANIYGNRSARAQSKQIAALSRKVNYISKVNAPEIRTMFKNFENEFTNSSLASNFYIFGMSPWVASYGADDQASGTLDLQGNFLRSRGFTLKAIVEYADNWRDSIADAAHDASASYRVVILQNRQSTPLSQAGQYSPVNTDIFETSNSLSSADTNTTAPLAYGINSTFKVLYSKTYTISRYHPIRQHKIHIPASKMLNYVRAVNAGGSSTASRGKIWVAILTGGLHSDIDYTSKIKFSASINLYFTDN